MKKSGRAAWANNLFFLRKQSNGIHISCAPPTLDEMGSFRSISIGLDADSGKNHRKRRPNGSSVYR
jgi:hypothetical protein